MRALAGVLLLVAAVRVHANPPPVPEPLRSTLGSATVVVLPSRCTGAVVETQWLVATARHCIDPDVPLRVRLGKIERDALLAEEDEGADQVVLTLGAPLPVKPLGVVRRMPIVGTVLYFHGNPSKPRWQAARLDRIGTCPSLPGVHDAIFTSIDGKPGDSGAPLVDLLGRVVGLVHGGARCRIATPGDRLARLVDRALARQHARNRVDPVEPEC